MKIGFKNEDFETRSNENFDLYIYMIKNSECGTKDFNYACQMLRNHLDFMIYNRDPQECDFKPIVK